MGWKGTVRSINSAANKSARAGQAQQNMAHRAHSKIDKNVEQVIKRATAFEKRVQTNPINALGLRYSTGTGFSSEPFDFSTELFQGAVNLCVASPGDSTKFSPSDFSSEGFSITPLELMVARWATFVAIRIENHNPEYKIQTPWYKKSDPGGSSIYVLDPRSSTYLHPIASTLTGEVLAGHPKIGIVAFEPFRQTTDSLELHISEVKLTSERGKKYSFHFEYFSKDLTQNIQDSMGHSSLVDEMRDQLSEQSEELRKLVPSSSGCLVFLLAITFGLAGIVAATNQLFAM